MMYKLIGAITTVCILASVLTVTEAMPAGALVLGVYLWYRILNHILPTDKR